MHRTAFTSLTITSLLALTVIGAGCTIITNPPPNGGPQPAGNHSKVPVAGAAQPAATTPATAAPTATATATPAVPAGPAGPRTTVDGKEYTTLSRAVTFGNGDNRPGAFRGFVYFLPATTTALPNFDSIAPAGVLFTQGFSVSAANYGEGFPGLDAGRFDYFGIRYEGDFAVGVQGEYTFKVESDDGARLVIDSLPVVVLDGVHTAQNKTNMVRLAAGPHRFRLDYFQAARGAVALKVSVTPPGGAEKPFSALF